MENLVLDIIRYTCNLIYFKNIDSDNMFYVPINTE